MGAFEDFVNKELPKRIATDEDGGGTGNLPVGKLLRTTGIGLLVETVDPTEVSIATTRQVLCRIGGNFEADTTLDLLNPGTGWEADGNIVTFAGATAFTEQVQVYRNGQLLYSGPTASGIDDVYFVTASGSLAFRSPIIKNDVIQVWGFTTSGTTTSG